MNQLITIKQLPIIEESLKTLKNEIESKTNMVKDLVCTEETVKDVKVIRSTLNKEFGELELQRKAIKEKILEPYVVFEKVYSECVSDSYKMADKSLKEKIDDVESKLKEEKSVEVEIYFTEVCMDKGIDFIRIEQANINITLSASLKALKEQAKRFIDKISDDLSLIATQELKQEILIDYKKTLNVSKSITDVIDRKKALQEVEAKKLEPIPEKKEAEPIKETVKIEKEPVYIANYKMTGTLKELKSVSAFLKSNLICYDVTDTEQV